MVERAGVAWTGAWEWFGIWNLEFGIWNLEFGIWNLEFGSAGFFIPLAISICIVQFAIGAFDGSTSHHLER